MDEYICIYIDIWILQQKATTFSRHEPFRNGASPEYYASHPEPAFPWFVLRIRKLLSKALWRVTHYLFMDKTRKITASDLMLSSVLKR